MGYKNAVRWLNIKSELYGKWTQTDLGSQKVGSVIFDLLQVEVSQVRAIMGL